MKKLISFAIVLLMVQACKKEENSILSKINEAKEQASAVGTTIENVTQASKASSNLGVDIERLSELEPLSNDKLKNWLPESIEELKRSSYKLGEMQMMGISSLNAVYINDDQSKSLDINLMDGAGPGAALTSSMLMLSSMDMEEETQNSIRRTVDKDGLKVLEDFEKDGSRSKVQFVYGNRYVIEMGGNMSIDELWSYVEMLKFDHLE